MRFAAVVGLVVGWVLSLASCGAPARPCSTSTCSGCCDSATGECLQGSAVFACGVGGNACSVCVANELCVAGGCERFDGGEYDAAFPTSRDASINFDAGRFDAGQVDAGADAGRTDAGTPVDAGRVDAGTVSFQTDLVPVFTRYCVSCHATRNTYAEVRARVVPGDPPSSLLYQKITGTQTQGAPMPLGGQLSNDDPAATTLIERWIRAGASNN